MDPVRNECNQPVRLVLRRPDPACKEVFLPNGCEDLILKVRQFALAVFDPSSKVPY